MTFKKKIQKFTCNPQITYFICSFACMTSLMQRYSLILQNFATSQFVKNGKKAT